MAEQRNHLRTTTEGAVHLPGGVQMNKGTALALALGSGYFLGRTKKLRLAMMVGGAIATGKAGSVGAGLIKRGVDSATKNSDLGGLSPALGEISGALKGNLAEAAKAATMAAVTSRANALADRISDQAEALRAGGTEGQDSPDDRDEDDERDQADRDVEDRGEEHTGDRRQRAARRDGLDDSKAGNGRQNGRAKGPTKRADRQERSDQQQSRGNGRRHATADDDQRARRHAER